MLHQDEEDRAELERERQYMAHLQRTQPHLYAARYAQSHGYGYGADTMHTSHAHQSFMHHAAQAAQAAVTASWYPNARNIATAMTATTGEDGKMPTATQVIQSITGTLHATRSCSCSCPRC